MLVDAQLRVDIRFLEAAIGDPCVRALDGAVDQRVGSVKSHMVIR